MQSVEIIVYRHPNPELRSYFISEEISSFRVEHFKRPMTRDSDIALKSLGRLGAKLVKDIMLIPQIQEVHIKPKEILVKKEEASSWGMIDERVMEAINRAIRRKRIRVVKG